MIDSVKQASAIVYFRALRSLGSFHPIFGTKDFIYSPCTCGRKHKLETIENGLPEPMLEECLSDIIDGYKAELGYLCQGYFREKSYPNE